MKKSTIVVKQSKFCNLRCSYCYEYGHLGNAERIAAAHYRKIFEFVEADCREHEVRPTYCWHGGEPLLAGAGYMAEVLDARTGFSHDDRARDVVQTNLAIKLDFALLRRFDHVSVSFDPFSDLRKDTAGRDTRIRVLKNLILLGENGIQPSCITVFCGSGAVADTFDFYNGAGIDFRGLPFYKSDSQEQAGTFGMSPVQMGAIYATLCRKWLAPDSCITVHPVDSIFGIAYRYLKGIKIPPHDKQDYDPVLLVETDGTLYAPGTAGHREYAYGNIFTDSRDAMLASEGRARAVQRAADGLSEVCRRCELFGACSGWFVAEGTDLETGKMTDCAIMHAALDMVHLLVEEA